MRQKHGGWDGPTSALAIRVLPAWWQTVAARIGFGALLVGMGFLASHWRVHSIEAQRRRLARLVDEQTVEIRRQRDHLAELATVDELTGLPNRRKVSERVDLELTRAVRYERPLSLLISDIDRFKQINDTRGHAAGDEALRAIALRGSPVIRETGILARWGGDEFVLVMPETDHPEGLAICRRLKEAIETSTGAPEEPALTISGGMATWTPAEGPTTSCELLSRAERALYRAKESGRDRICADHDTSPRSQPSLTPRPPG